MKKHFRNLVRNNVAQMSESEKIAQSVAVCVKILATQEWQEAQTVLLYDALSDEIDLSRLFIEAKSAGKIVFCPSQTADAEFLSDEVCAEIDLAIIPGRAFTIGGKRLGRGKGYYDRLLSHINCPTFGIGFDCQIFEDIPTDPWDIQLDRIIFPKRH